MEENQVINEINEEVVNSMYEEIPTSNGSVVAKIVAGALVIAAGVGAFIFYKKKKESKKEIEISEPIVIEENDKNEELN